MCCICCVCLLYLRRAVNLLPFLLALLCSLLFGRCSLEANAQDQEEEHQLLLDTHLTCQMEPVRVRKYELGHFKTIVSMLQF